MNQLARVVTAAARLPGMAGRTGIVKASELAQGASAESVLATARREANDIVEAATVRAVDLIAAAHADAQRDSAALAEAAEQLVWRRALERERQYEQQLAALSATMEEHALAVVGKAFAALAAELPPRERIRASVRTLMAEVGEAPDCLLRVSEADLAAVQAMQGEIPWQIRADAGQGAGQCLLVAERGTWSTSFAGQVQALLAAIGNRPE